MWTNDPFMLVKAETALRQLDSALEQIPIYLLYADEVATLPFTFSSNWAAVTMPGLDLRLEPELRSRGLWEGRGFAAVFERHSYEPQFVAAAIHEAAHFIDDLAGTANEAPANHRLHGCGTGRASFAQRSILSTDAGEEFVSQWSVDMAEASTACRTAPTTAQCLGTSPTGTFIRRWLKCFGRQLPRDSRCCFMAT